MIRKSYCPGYILLSALRIRRSYGIYRTMSLNRDIYNYMNKESSDFFGEQSWKKVNERDQDGLCCMDIQQHLFVFCDFSFLCGLVYEITLLLSVSPNFLECWLASDS